MEMPRRQRRHPAQACPDRGRTVPRSDPSNVDKLAFKYMEMCKVESSTDSESDVSPRWSDTSTMGCGSSAAESRRVPRSLSCGRKPAGRHPPCHSLSLDPYDGSSEDSSDTSDPPGFPRRQRQPQGACRFWGRTSRQAGLYAVPPVLRDRERDPSRAVEQRDGGPANQRYQTLIDVQMRSGSDSDLWGCGMETPPSCQVGDGQREPEGDVMAVESGPHTRSGDSGMHTTPSPFSPVEGTPLYLPESSSENSPSSPFPPRCVSKRKLGLVVAAGGDGGARKRLCVTRKEAGGESPLEVISDLT